MNEEIFFEKVADALQVDKCDVHEAFEFSNDTLDSLAVLEIIAVIDEQFGITVPAEKLKKCTSVGAILDLVRSQGSPA